LARTTLVRRRVWRYSWGLLWARSNALADATLAAGFLRPVVYFRLPAALVSTLLLLLCLFFGVGWWRGAAMARQMAPYQAFSKQKDGGCGAGGQRRRVTVTAVPVGTARYGGGPGAYRGAGARRGRRAGNRRLGVPAVLRGDVVT